MKKFFIYLFLLSLISLTAYADVNNKSEKDKKENKIIKGLKGSDVVNVELDPIEEGGGLFVAEGIGPEKSEDKYYEETPFRRFEITFFISFPFAWLIMDLLLDQIGRAYVSMSNANANLWPEHRINIFPNTYSLIVGDNDDARYLFLAATSLLIALTIAFDDYQKVFLNKKSADLRVAKRSGFVDNFYLAKTAFPDYFLYFPIVTMKF